MPYMLHEEEVPLDPRGTRTIAAAKHMSHGDEGLAEMILNAIGDARTAAIARTTAA